MPLLLFFPLSILPYFISFNAQPLSPPAPPRSSLAGTDAGIFELIGTNRRQKTKADKGRAEE